MTPFRGYYLILIVAGASAIAGNTFFPVFFRLFIWTLSKIVPRHSKIHHSLSFLLHHPRRCYLYIFPSTNTWYLAAAQFGMYMIAWFFFEILNLGLPAVVSIPVGERIFDGLFQAVGVRMTGYYIIVISYLAPGLLVLFLVLMYISHFPVIISVRSTNIYEEKSLGIQDSGGDDNNNESEKSFVGSHIRQQLAYDIWWLFLAWFLLCIIERTALTDDHPGFGIFEIMFESVSAYGTVGLSTGVPYDDYSLCGAFHTLSKLILILVMLRGRHRILPIALDRAVLLPGEELMEKMDREYNIEDRGDYDEQTERVRHDEQGEEAETRREGQDPEENENTKRRLGQGLEEGPD